MLIAFNKPHGVVCQFSPHADRPTLADYIDVADVYAAGRLDADSEGLLLLTDDGALQHRITDPAHKWPKTYLVQVEGTPSPKDLERLEKGVELTDGPARAESVRLLAKKPGWLWRRDPPVDPRPGKTTAWLEILLTEGRNRQVRRMSAAVGLPTLRLVRTAVGDYALEGLQPGDWREVPAPPY